MSERRRGLFQPARAAAILALAALLGGLGACQAQVRRLDPEELPVPPSPLELPFRDSISVELSPDGGGYADARGHQLELSARLREAAIFDRVRQARSGPPTSLVLRGDVRGEFETNGAANFFSWFLGPLVFAQTWHGTMHLYRAEADLTLVEVETERVLGRYRADVAYEISHRSANPGQILGTALIVPGVVKGSMSMKPRAKYRRLAYEAAYQELWRQIVAQLLADQGPRYTRLAQEQRARCGPRYDALPTVGELWANFVACQSRAFEWLHDENTSHGTESVYLRSDGALEVNVMDEVIARWHEPGPISAEAVSVSPPADVAAGAPTDPETGVPTRAGPTERISLPGDAVEEGAAAPAPAADGPRPPAP